MSQQMNAKVCEAFNAMLPSVSGNSFFGSSSSVLII